MKDELHVGLPEGITQGSKVGEEDRPRIGLPERPGTLAEWGRTRVFFNHGLWFSRGGLDRDIVIDVCTQIGADLMPVAFDPSIFGGVSTAQCRSLPWLPRIPLNNLLLSVAEEHWGTLGNELRCFAWVDRKHGILYRSIYQELTIIDPLAMCKMVVQPAQLPLARVIVFGVESNKRTLVFHEATTYPGSLSQVIELPPRKETIDLAAAHLAGRAKPFQAIESEDPFEGVKGIVPPTY